VANGSRICPQCGKLNAREDANCFRCGARLPAGWEITARSRWTSALQRRGWATTTFMLLDVGVYLALMLGSGGGGLFSSVSRLETLRWGALAGALGHVEPWRYLSAMFVHFSLFHVGFNTLSLYSLGRSLEDSLGWSRLVVVFLGTGIFGFVLSEVWYTTIPLTGGISGGIFGLLGAGVGWRYAQHDPEWKRQALTAGGYAIAMALLPGITVNHAAHVGGLLSGAGLGWALHRFGHGRTADRALDIAGGLLMLAAFVSIGLSLTSPVIRRLSPSLIQ
jgi:membrane associated rhomboid family serine protease